MTSTKVTGKTIRKLAGGTIFSVVFTKRTTGEKRKMTCRLRVSKGLSGKGLKYDPSAKGLLPVYDVVNKGYRMISLDTIEYLRIRGEEYHFSP